MEHAEHKEHSEKTPHKKGRKKASSQNMLLWGVLAALLLVIGVVFGVASYGVKNASENGFVVAAAGVFNLPIASIDGLNVTYADYIKDMQALRTYNTSQGVESTSEEVSDRALSRLLVNRLSANVAAQEGVTVEQAGIDEAIQALKDQFPSEEALNEEMENNFGWSFETFVERIIVPSLREQKLAEHFQSTPPGEGDEYASEQVKARHILFAVEEGADKEAVKAEAQKVLDRVKAGEDFEVLAKEFGSDGTKEVGGDLGWFAKGVMVPEFEAAAFALEPGELSEELVETQFGYHIVRVDEKRTIRDFASYMDARLSNAKIEVYGDIHNPFESIVTN